MQRKVFLSFAVASITSFALLVFCSAEPKPAKGPATGLPMPASTAPDRDNDDVSNPATGANSLLGTYVGPFGKHRITICLQNVVGETVNGYSVVAGNVRAFSGSLVENPRAFEAHVREPGDDKNDGNFVLEYHPDTRRLTGTWTANDPTLAKIEFDLPRKSFKYNPKQGKYPQASTRTLKTGDVENMRPEDLRIMRNEIYARHGYTFRLADMREYFDRQDWYMPISMNVSTQLTNQESKNEALIKKYETYAAEQYDAFGR